QTAIRHILDTPTTNYRVSFADVVPISFLKVEHDGSEVDDSGQIDFFQAYGATKRESGEQYPYFSDSGSPSDDKAPIIFNAKNIIKYGVEEGSQMYWVMMHETAHALSLDHTSEFRKNDP